MQCGRGGIEGSNDNDDICQKMYACLLLISIGNRAGQGRWFDMVTDASAW